MRRTFLIAALLALTLPLANCGFVVVHAAKKAYEGLTKDEREIDTSLERYAGYVARGDADRAAAMFEDAAELANATPPTLNGRSAIRASLAAPGGPKFVDYKFEPTSTSVSGGKGRQEGSYQQRWVASGGQVTEARGSFDAEWAQQPGGTWLIHRLKFSAPR